MSFNLSKKEFLLNLETVNSLLLINERDVEAEEIYQVLE